jgi:hypothetical protein
MRGAGAILALTAIVIVAIGLARHRSGSTPARQRTAPSMTSGAPAMPRATPILTDTLPLAQQVKTPATRTATPLSTPTATASITATPTAQPATMIATHPAPPTHLPTSTAGPARTATSMPTRSTTSTPAWTVRSTATPHGTPHVRHCAGATPPCPLNALLPGTLLIADRGNSRLIEVDAARRIIWSFPRPGDLVADQAFVGPDDAFFTPDGRHIVTNQEEAQTIGIIDYRTRRLVWQYGHLYYRGSAPGYLNEPDDAYQLPNGLVTVADIRNCRIIFLSRAGKVVRQYGETGVCLHDPPHTFASPNGDTPLPDGGMLVTEIGGNYVVRLDRKGHVVFSFAVPWVSYASDAQLLHDGSVLLSDYSSPGGIVRVSPRGKLLWRYTPTRSEDVLNRPSLAIMLPNGLIAANDDWNHRVVLIDQRRQMIVWQYGVTGVPGSVPGYLDVPDGIFFRPKAR